MSLSKALWSILFLLLCCQIEAFGVQLQGAGSPNAVTILASWSADYIYTRDDIRISYTNTGVTSALEQYADGELDFICIDRFFSDADAATYGNLIQFPLMGQAIVMAYNIPSLASLNASLIIDRETLGLIWAGNITMWTDQRIKDLNPGLASFLPNTNITIGYNQNTVYSLTEVVKRSLESFSPDFARLFEAAGRDFANMPPALSGTAESAGVSTAERVVWLGAHQDSITYLSYADATKAGFRHMSMYNKAGSLVTPSTASVQAAMSQFQAQFARSNFSVDILDAGGASSWPISYLTYLTMDRNVSGIDCTAIQELLAFAAWVHTNDGASTDATSINIVPLDTSLKKRIVDLLSTVQCNGERAYSTAFLIGIGSPLPIFTSWSVAWSSAQTRAKFYLSSSTTGKDRLVNNNSDFSVTSNGLESSYVTQMPDAEIVPTTAFALVPAYNVPELKDKTLVLDFTTIAGIFLNNVTRWNDQRIKDLNSADVAAALPDEEIIVVTHNVSSAYTQLFTQLLSQTVPEFAAQVGSGLVQSNRPTDRSTSAPRPTSATS